MKRKIKKDTHSKKPAILSRGMTEEERGGALLLVDEEDIQKTSEESNTTKDLETVVEVDDLVVDDDSRDKQSMETQDDESVDIDKEEEVLEKKERPQTLRTQPVVVLKKTTGPEHPLDSLFDDDDAMDFSRLDTRRSRKGLILGIFVVLVCLGIAAYSGYQVFRNQTTQGSGDVSVDVTVQEKVASGDVVDIDITFTNNKSVALTDVNVDIIYPDGFLPNTTTPEADDDHKRSFTFRDVLPGAGGAVHVVGQLVGSTGQTKNVTAIITYQPSNFSQEFQTQDTAATTISSSQINLTVDAPKQVAAGQEVALKFTYTNQAAIALENVRIDAVYPSDFVVTSVDPQASREQAVWLFDRLEPGSTSTITILGKFAGNSGDSKEINMNIGIEEIDGTIHPQTTQSVLVVVVNPEFSVELDLPDVVSSTDDITVKTTVKNTADADMQDIEMRWEVVGPVSGKKSWSDSFKKISASQSKDTSHVLTLDAGKNTDESVQVTVSIPTARLNGNTISLNTSVQKTIKIRSSQSFAYFARYFDDNLKKIGSGPIPPTVGETTTYALDFSVSTELNGLSDVTCSATLPSHVTYVSGEAPASYNTETRVVSWSYATLAAKTTQAIQLMVSVTPEDADVDHLLVLSEKLLCNGTNAFTDEQISEELPRVTTELSKDEAAAGKGVVVE